MLFRSGLGNTIEEACENASQEMLRYMIQDLKIDNHEAAKLLCLCSDLKICQIINQVKTVVCRIQKSILEHIA